MKLTNLLFLPVILCMFLGCAKNKQDNPSPVNEHSTNTDTVHVPVNDPNIRFFGRWDFSSSTQFISYWGGAYIKVKFTGTKVKIKVGNTSNFYAKIDNGDWTSYLAANGTINLTPTALTSGTHVLSVAQGKDYDYVFNFQGLILDPGASIKTPSVGTDLIEYIGDSITCGFTDNQANVSDYAWVCSESLGAEHTQIAFPGIALVNGYGVNTNKTGMDVQYFKLQSLGYTISPDWNSNNYTPKIVIINLGQNDQGTSVPDKVFQADYITFLSNIRAKFANAEIFALRTFTGVKVAPTQAAVNARIAAGDNKVHFIDTNGWLTSFPSADYNDGAHPSVSGHIKAANLLKTHLAPYLTSSTSITNSSDK